MAKYTLDNDPGDLDFALLGISSPDDQYRVVSLVNDCLGISLRLGSYVPVTLKMGRVYNFSLYTYTDTKLGIEYCLLPNSSNFEPPGARRAPEAGSGADLFEGQDVDESTRLIKELPKTDYFLLLKGELHENHQYKVLSLLKQVEGFTQVQPIEPQALPSRKNLIF